MECFNCSMKIPRNMHIHRSYDIAIVDEKGRRVKSSVDLIACSGRCLQECASGYDLWVEKEADFRRSTQSFHGGAGY